MTPLSIRIGLAILVLAMLGGIYGAGRIHGGAKVKLRWDAAISAQREQARLAEQEARRIETERAAVAAKAEADGQRKLMQARTDAARARTAADRLRDALAGVASGTASDPSTPVECADARAAIPVLSDMLGKSVERNRVVAEFADASHAASESCVSAWQGLK